MAVTVKIRKHVTKRKMELKAEKHSFVEVKAGDFMLNMGVAAYGSGLLHPQKHNKRKNKGSEIKKQKDMLVSC